MSKPYIQHRPTTDPATVVLALVYAVRDQLYRDDQIKYFHCQLKDLKHAITWPATWLNEKAIYVSPERYQEIILEAVQEIKRHGHTGEILYWPRYLLKCLQDHFGMNAERYVDEGKTARDLVARLVSALPSPVADPAAVAESFTRGLATAHALLKSPGGRARPKKPAAVQQELL